jgi:subtilisin family serine protease
MRRKLFIFLGALTIALAAALFLIVHSCAQDSASRLSSFSTTLGGGQSAADSPDVKETVSIDGDQYVNSDKGYFDNNGARYRKGSISAVLKNGTTEASAKAIGASLGYELSRYFDATEYSEEGDESCIWVEYKVPEGKEEEAIKALSQIDEVAEAHPTWVMSLFDSDSSSEYPAETADLQPAYGEYHLVTSGFKEAWETVKCSGSTYVAVLDSGAPSQGLADLAPNIDYEKSVDMCESGSIYDSNGHGTTVSSLISAVADGEDNGCTGCSWDAKVISVKVADSDDITAADVIDAIDYVSDLNCNVSSINMSFGGPEGHPWVKDQIICIQRAIAKARNHGIVCVAASGNDGLLPSDLGLLPNAKMYPAACDGVVSVGATRVPSTVVGGTVFDAKLAELSNTASSVDIVASGMAIVAWGKVADPVSSLIPHVITINRGTSFSSPQVASAVALVKTAHGDWSADRIEAAMEKTARHCSEMTSDEGKRDDRYGYGYLDASAAVLYESGSSSSGGQSGGSPYTGSESLEKAWLELMEDEN